MATDAACFNREFITEMGDIASASILQLEALANGNELSATPLKDENALLRTSLPLAASNLPDSILMHDDDDDDDHFVFNSERRMDFDAQRASDARTAPMAELESQLVAEVNAGHTDKVAALLRESPSSASASASAPLKEVSSTLLQQLWRALVAAPPDAVAAAIAADLPDYSYVDDINARTPLHLSVLANQRALAEACIAHGVDVGQCDVYGRSALAYAAMHNYVDMCTYLLSLPGAKAHPNELVNRLDLDGFSALLHAIVRGHTEVVRLLLEFCRATGVAVPSKTDASDLAPLAIAAQRGYVEISRLLLEYGAKVEMNTEGLMPQTLAARAGHTEVLQLLIDAKVDVNVVEKSTLCTPLFYAAEYGHADCVAMLLKAGASIEPVDEKGRHAVFYAAWHGWRECTHILLEAHRNAAVSVVPSTPHAGPTHLEVMDPDADLDGDGDGIPSLHLPPPIIPFRTYGHSYLDKRSLVCLSVGKASVHLLRASDGDRPEMVPGLASSLKLVLTPQYGGHGTAPVAVPHTIVFPMADDREEVTFQSADLDHFYLDCELFPTFGSTRVGKTVILPSVFQNAAARTEVQLPLLDWHLNSIGHVRFVVECVRPYGSVQLQIGGRVETYWKSTLARQNQPLTISPPSQMAGARDAHDAHDTSAYVTASSLSGNYLRARVHFTQDCVPVVSHTTSLPADVWSPPISQLSADILQKMAAHTGRAWDSPDTSSWHLSQWAAKLSTSVLKLETLLAAMPTNMGLAIEVVIDNLAAAPLNQCIDALLHAVYDAAQREKRSRRLFFSSSVPSVCVALNWKQPNYAVFFINLATLDKDAAVSTLPPTADPRQSSVAEAVRFAKDNNLLGVMMDAHLLEHVPELIPAIKAASLVVITLSRPNPSSELAQATSSRLLGPPAVACHEVFDGFLHEDIIQCTK